ncbi:MAG: helix-turn-helix domain-containing protein, partial [Candidatus Nanopelagicales bacterium]
WSTHKLGAVSGVGSSTVRRVEGTMGAAREPYEPSVRVVGAIAVALGCDVGELVRAYQTPGAVDAGVMP